jgi:hypothetical protein
MFSDLREVHEVHTGVGGRGWSAASLKSGSEWLSCMILVVKVQISEAVRISSRPTFLFWVY